MALSWIALAWTAAYVATVGRAFAPAAKQRSELPRTARVLVVRPCAGAAPWLDETLSSWPRSNAHTLRWVAAVQGPADPAWRVAHAACDKLATPARELHVFATAATGPNHKADQIARTVAALGADCDVLVVADSDVDLSSVDLDALVASLATPGVAAVWCPTVETTPRTVADRLGASIVMGSLHAFAVLGRLTPALFVGKLFAVRMDELAALGGFASLRRHLGEDFELARRLRERGSASAQSSIVAHSHLHGRRLAAVFERHTRWFVVLRAQRPVALLSVPLLLAAAPLLLALAAVLATQFATIAIAMAAIVLLARLAVVWLGHRRADQPLAAADLALALPADLVLLAALVRCLTTRRVRWADRSLRIGAEGLLEPLAAEREPHAGDPIESGSG